MAYIGKAPNTAIVNQATSQSFSGNGSTTAFTLTRSVNVGEDLEVFVNNVQQEPGSGKSYTASGTTLTFDEAPPSGTNNVYVIYRGEATINPRLEHDANNPLAATTGTFTGDLTVDTSTLKVDAANNRGGIGLAAPEQLLHVRNASGNCVAVVGQYGTGTKATITAAANQVEIKADSGTNDFITFKTGSSERVRIQSGGGISFNGDTAAVNALDDYEEGSFDPKIFQTGTEVGDAAYNSGFTGGQYTKIGRMCFITLSIRLTSKGTVTASNQLQIGGLPFVPIANVRARTAVSLFDHVGAGIDTSGNTNGTLMGLLTSSGTVSFRVSDVSGTVGEPIQYADVGDSLYLQLSFFFETS